MAKLQNIVFLKNSKGQSVVEYILLLAVLTSLGYSIYSSKKFKDFIGGTDKGFFVALKKGMAYSYRYGRDLNPTIDYDEAMNFNYQSNKHDTYYNTGEGRSRFFGGITPYGGQ